MFTWPGTNIICNTWLPIAKHNIFISGAASEKTAVKLISESKMAASDYGFMVFSVKGDEPFVQTINWKGEIIYTAVIKK